jgi:hypothetical protein
MVLVLGRVYIRALLLVVEVVEPLFDGVSMSVLTRRRSETGATDEAFP